MNQISQQLSNKTFFFTSLGTLIFLSIAVSAAPNKRLRSDYICRPIASSMNTSFEIITSFGLLQITEVNRETQKAEVFPALNFRKAANGNNIFFSGDDKIEADLKLTKDGKFNGGFIRSVPVVCELG